MPNRTGARHIRLILVSMQPFTSAFILLSVRGLCDTRRIRQSVRAGSIGVLVTLAGCAGAPRVAIQPPLRVFHDVDVAQAEQSLQRACTAAGMSIVKEPPHRLTCIAQLDGEQVILARLWMRNTADRLPVRKTEFVLLQTGANVGVDATQWIETYTDDGQTLRNGLTMPTQVDQLRTLVDSAQ
jgi:hypothetical protein